VQSDQGVVDIGGSLNVLVPSRTAMQGTHSMAPNACMVQVEKWTGRLGKPVSAAHPLAATTA
jgi:hypothetical protein